MESGEEAIQEYMGSLKKIVEQLEKCGYESEGGKLELNVAFVALKKMAEDESKYIQIEVTEEMNKRMDKCAEGECEAEDCIGCCCQICILNY